MLTGDPRLGRLSIDLEKRFLLSSPEDSEGTGMSTTTGTLNSTQRMDTTAAIARALSVIGWACAFPAIRAGLAAFQPLELGALRFAIAAVPAAIFLAVKRPALPR